MAPTMGISRRIKLNPDAIPTIFEGPEPTSTSSIASSDSGDAATISRRELSPEFWSGKFWSGGPKFSVENWSGRTDFFGKNGPPLENWSE